MKHPENLLLSLVKLLAQKVSSDRISQSFKQLAARRKQKDISQVWIPSSLHASFSKQRKRGSHSRPHTLSIKMKYQDRVNRGRVRRLRTNDQANIQEALKEIHSNTVWGLKQALLFLIMLIYLIIKEINVYCRRSSK